MSLHAFCVPLFLSVRPSVCPLIYLYVRLSVRADNLSIHPFPQQLIVTNTAHFNLTVNSFFYDKFVVEYKLSDKPDLSPNLYNAKWAK